MECYMCVCARLANDGIPVSIELNKWEGETVKTLFKMKKIKMTIAYHKLSTDTREFCS